MNSSQQLVGDMQVAILAGGLGTRLRPITETIPKPMALVSGKPFLYWQLRDLKAQGFSRVLLLVSYLGEQIEKHFGDGKELGLKLSYVYEPEPLGTGGALKKALPYLDQEFVLLNGDSFLRTSLKSLIDTFHRFDFKALISVYDNHDPVPVIPNIKVTNGCVTDYLKDAGRSRGFAMIDSGIYILNRSVFETGPNGKFMLADLWPELIRLKKVGALEVKERFYDIGTQERLKEFEDKISDYFPNAFSH